MSWVACLQVWCHSCDVQWIYMFNEINDFEMSSVISWSKSDAPSAKISKDCKNLLLMWQPSNVVFGDSRETVCEQLWARVGFEHSKLLRIILGNPIWLLFWRFSRKHADFHRFWLPTSRPMFCKTSNQYKEPEWEPKKIPARHSQQPADLEHTCVWANIHAVKILASILGSESIASTPYS